MWKFILFIIIGSVVIWQLGLLNIGTSNTPQQSPSDVVTKSVKEKKPETKTKSKPQSESSVKIKKSALENLISGKTQSIKIEEKKEEAKEIKPLKDAKEKLQKITQNAVERDNYQNMLAQEANEDLKTENAVVVKGVKNPVEEKKAPQSEEEKYEAMLASEAQNAAGDNVVRMTKEPDTKIKEEQIEPKEEESVKPVISDDKTSHVLFRENLKKLISNAGINVKDKKIASLLEEETQTDNAVKVKSESKKDLIKNIIKEVVKQGPEKESSYVVGLLKEVSSSKIDILKVEKDSTIVKIKEGDNLWNIAKRIYGNGFKYKLIYEANKDKLTNPNLVTVGMIIKVPKSK